MKPERVLWTQLDEQGRLVLPLDEAEGLGWLPGRMVQVRFDADGLKACSPVEHLARLYIEPTNGCNLACRMCIRNQWKEPVGQMSAATFDRIVDGLRGLPSTPTVFLGGFGEPLLHPDTAKMVSRMHEIGASVELITNGLLLNEGLSRELVESGLNILWVSVDGATPESYAEIRLGAALETVFDHVADFRKMSRHALGPRPEIGFAFVAMKRNIADFPALMRMGTKLGVTRYMVTNLLPYTRDLCDQILYHRSLSVFHGPPSPWVPLVDLPQLDLDENSHSALYHVVHGINRVRFNWKDIANRANHCPFISRNSAAIAWDGGISPCLPLMHDSQSYLDRTERLSRRWVVGNVNESSLNDLWALPDYVKFRQRVLDFDFSPCTICGGCGLREANEEDCYGNPFPTCGGCLWAQGVIQCP